MGARIDTFTPDLIHKFDRLKTLFTGEKELAEIDQLPDEALVRSKDFRYFNRWQVAWIVLTSPFAFITYLVVKTVATVTHYLYLRSLSNRLHVLAAYLTLNIDQLASQATYGSSLLVPSMGTYQLSLSDIYTQYSVNREKILDPKIRQKLNENLNQIDYYMPRGLCWGGVHWFNYLLLNQLQKGRNSLKAILGVAKQFESGQPRQAALLQSIYGLEYDLLDIDYKLTSIEEDRVQDSSYVLEVIDELEEGVYTLQLPGHSVSYIKLANMQMLWDPPVGLFPIERPEHLVEYIQQHCEGREKLPVHFALQNLRSGIFLRLQKILKFTTLSRIYV